MQIIYETLVDNNSFYSQLIKNEQDLEQLNEQLKELLNDVKIEQGRDKVE